MKRLGSSVTRFFATLAGAIATIWGITEGYTYFTEDNLRDLMGVYWWLVYYLLPTLIALLVTMRHFYVQPARETDPSRESKPISSETQEEAEAHRPGPAQPVNRETNQLMESTTNNRLQLIKRLNATSQANFDTLISVLRPPPGQMPADHANRTQRVNALLDWVESPEGCGLAVLERTLEEVLGS